MISSNSLLTPNMKVNKSQLISVLLFLVFANSYCQQTSDEVRGILPLGKQSSGHIEGENFILTIGIDKYDNWSELDNAVNDAKGVHNLFTEKLGFKEFRAPILNEEATKENILSVIENDMVNDLGENDNLVIFFAGHGESFARRIGSIRDTIGYLIPVDGEPLKEKRTSTYIKSSDFMNAIDQLPAKHILVILDACKSGIAIKTLPGVRNSNQYSNEMRRKMSRKIVTSAQANQVASDGGPVDGHSLFTGTLINGFKQGLEIDLYPERFVTSSEIGQYLKAKVGQNNNGEIFQTPDFGAFGHDQRGELVIDLRDESFPVLISSIERLMQAGDLTEAWQQLSILKQNYPQNLVTIYYLYRKAMFQNNYNNAKYAFLKYFNLDHQYDRLGDLSFGDVQDLDHRLDYFNDLLEVKKSLKDLKLTVFKISWVDQTDGSQIVVKDKIVPVINDDGLEQYTLDSGSSYQFLLSNSGKTNLFIYSMLHDSKGNFRMARIIEDWGVLDNGLAKGSKILTAIIENNGVEGLVRWDFFGSDKRNRTISNPINRLSRGSRNSINLEGFKLSKKQVYLVFK